MYDNKVKKMSLCCDGHLGAVVARLDSGTDLIYCENPDCDNLLDLEPGDPYEGLSVIPEKKKMSRGRSRLDSKPTGSASVSSVTTSIRMTPSMQSDIRRMAQETGRPVGEIVRESMAIAIAKWKNEQD